MRLQDDVALSITPDTPLQHRPCLLDEASQVRSDGRSCEVSGVVIGRCEARRARLGWYETRRNAAWTESRSDWWGPGAWSRGEMSRRPISVSQSSQCLVEMLGS